MNIEKWKIKNKDGKKYTHFDYKVSLDRVWDYISDPKKVEKHGFYPMIHYTLLTKKYNKNKGITEKEREICYSAHIDRFIFKYYGFKLNQIYNEKVIKDNINNSAIAYRDNLYKNNIHFAKQAIDFIKETKNCIIIIGDFKSFFDRLEHKYLKEMLCDLLKVEKLPNDYYAVFKNITKYSTWDLESLLFLNGLENNKKGVTEFNKLPVALPVEKFKELKKRKGYITPHKNSAGIPQGSAISAVLSNIYMLKFDKKANDYIIGKKGLYMRYSDDFIIVLPNKNISFKEEFQYINSMINSTLSLELAPEKTQTFQFKNGLLQNCNKSVLNKAKNGVNLLNYLGFTFDGRVVTIRDKTVSKYYYKLYRKIKTITKNKGITKKGNRISQKNLYKKYSIKGAKSGGKRKGNFITYVKRAEKIFGTNEKVDLVARRHMQKIKKRLSRLK